MADAQTLKTETRIVGRLFRKILPIQALAVGLPALNTLINSLIVGRFLGADALAGMGFYGPMAQLMVGISSMIAIGAQMKCGQCIGQGDTDALKKYFSTALAMCVVIVLPVALAAQFFPAFLAGLLGAGSDVAPLTVAYIRGMAPGLIFIALQGTLLPFLQLDRRDKVCTAVVVLLLVFNLAGNLVNVLVLHWGLLGTGLFTSLANAAAAAAALVYILTHSAMFRLSPKYMSGKAAKDICLVGAPAALSPFCVMFRDRILNQYIYTLGGSVAMSAMSIAGSVCTAFGSMIEAGYSGSSRMVASVLVGERDTASLRDLPRVMAQKAWFLYIGIYAVVFVFAKPLALLFGADAANIDIYVWIVRLFNLWYITNIIKAAPLAIYQAMGNTKLMSALTVYSNFLVPAVLALTLGKSLGIYFIASLAMLSEVFTIIAYAVIFTVKAHRLPRSIFELCYVPHTISAPKENRMKAEVRSQDDAVNVAQQAEAFCREKQLDEKKSTCCGICLEEMLMGIIRHGFTGKDDVIDVRLIYEDGHVTILIRDDCKPFDPVKWLAVSNDTDPTHGMGIRMVQKLSEHMAYVNSLGWNVLTIRL